MVTILKILLLIFSIYLAIPSGLAEERVPRLPRGLLHDLQSIVRIDTSNDTFTGQVGTPRPVATRASVDLLVDILARERVISKLEAERLKTRVCQTGQFQEIVSKCGIQTTDIDAWIFQTHPNYSDVVSLFVRLRGKSSQRLRSRRLEYGDRHRKRTGVMLLSHLDTVTVDSPHKNWITCDPYAGEIVEGEVCGRGVLDMLGLVILHLHSFIEMTREKELPAHDLSVLFVPDEERGGRHGTEWLVHNLFEKNPALQPKTVLGEGGFITEPGVILPDERAMSVSVAERSTHFIRLTAEGKSAHAGVQSDENAVTLLSRAIVNIEDDLNTPSNYQICRRLLNPPKVSAPTFEALRPWLLNAIPKYQFSSWTFCRNPMNANFLANQLPLPARNMLFDTIAPLYPEPPKSSILATPTHAEVILSVFRIPGEKKGKFHYGSFDDLLERIRTSIDDERVKVDLLEDIAETQVVTPASSLDNSVFQKIIEVAKENRGVSTVPIVTPPGTDLRFFRYHFDSDAYGVFPVVLSEASLASIHGVTDEKVKVTELAHGLKFFNDVLSSYLYPEN